MLDISYIREHPEEVKTSAKQKGFDVDVDRLLELDIKRRDLINNVEKLRAKRNELAAQNKSGPPSPEQIAQGKEIKDQLGAKEDELAKFDDEYHTIMLQVPNSLHESVPVGDESANKVIKTVGEKPQFDFEPLDHETLGKKLDVIDIESAAKISGSRFYYLKNGAVELEFALIQWVLEVLKDKGFAPITVPTLVREPAMEATGFFPAEKNEIYKVNEDDDQLYLIGTSEVPLAGLHMNSVLDATDLPKRYVGFSTNYRREAGSYGKDTKGIIRVHQFDKLELFAFTKPEDSWQEHDHLLEIEEEILGALGLHYQVVNIASADLGVPAAKKYDCEAWLPSQNRFREVTSCSNTTDFQARRGNIRFKSGEDTRFVHTINGTAVAIPRILAAIMEQFQTKDGQVRLPEVLGQRMGRETL